MNRITDEAILEVLKTKFDWTSEPRDGDRYKFKPEDVVVDRWGFWDYGDCIHAVDPTGEMFRIYYINFQEKKILEEKAVWQA